MDESMLRAVHRIALQMIEFLHDRTDTDLHFFMGLGLALAMCYEESTGHSAMNMKPAEILEWVANLPKPQYKRIET